jgi:parallel beta-helix repeat protein
MVRIAALFGLLLATALPAVASDLFVNNATGDDHNDALAAVSQGGRSGPARSLTKALYVAERGDRIVIAKTSQPYRENVTLAGGRHNGLVIDGNGATFDGSMPVPIDQWHSEGDGVFRFDPRYKHFNLLFIGDNPAQRAAADPLSLRPPRLKPLEFCVHKGSIYFRSEETKSPRLYPLYYTAQPVGITLYNVQDAVVKDLVIQGYRLDGVNAHDDAQRCVLAGLTCRHNARSGISVGGSSRVEITDCQASGNGVTQLRTEGHCVVTVQDSKLANDATPAYRAEGGRLSIDGQRVENFKSQPRP